jgi:hypothetical protein
MIVKCNRAEECKAEKCIHREPHEKGRNFMCQKMECSFVDGKAKRVNFDDTRKMSE